MIDLLISSTFSEICFCFSCYSSPWPPHMYRDDEVKGQPIKVLIQLKWWLGLSRDLQFGIPVNRKHSTTCIQILLDCNLTVKL